MGIEQIELFNALFYASMALAVLGLGAAVFFFFYFDIPLVYRMKTGKAKEGDREKLRGDKKNSDQLRRKEAAEIIQRHGEMTDELLETTQRGNTVQMVHEDQQATTMLGVAPETTILAASETTVLHPHEECADTSVLSAGNAEAECGETALLSQNRPGMAQPPAGLNFQIIEHTIMLNTNELI